MTTDLTQDFVLGTGASRRIWRLRISGELHIGDEWVKRADLSDATDKDESLETFNVAHQAGTDFPSVDAAKKAAEAIIAEHRRRDPNDGQLYPGVWAGGYHVTRPGSRADSNT